MLKIESISDSLEKRLELNEQRFSRSREMIEEKFCGDGIYELKVGRIDCGIFGDNRGLKDVVKRKMVGKKKYSIFVEIREIV